MHQCAYMNIKWEKEIQCNFHKFSSSADAEHELERKKEKIFNNLVMYRDFVVDGFESNIS